MWLLKCNRRLLGGLLRQKRLFDQYDMFCLQWNFHSFYLPSENCKSDRVARFSQPNPTNCYSKLNKIHVFWWGSPGKIHTSYLKIRLNITLLGSLQPTDKKNNPRQQC